MSFLHAALTRERVRVSQLTTLYEKFGATGSFLAELFAEIELDDEATLPATSWLLRRYTADHANIPDKPLGAAVEILSNSSNWVVRLHLCRIFSEIDCPTGTRETLFGFLSRNARDSNAFVRAWALTALYRLKAKVSADDRRLIDRLLKSARSDPEKCVQARLRRIREKQGKPIRADNRIRR